MGAGLAGLTAAQTITAAGYTVAVLEKSRAVGGRMATKHLDGAYYDQGAQRFRARSADFQEAVEEWRRSGVVRTWFEEKRIGQQEPVERLIGSNGMRGIAEHLAKGMDVRLATHVGSVTAEDGGIVAETDSGPVTGAAAIVTAPLPQMLEIVDLSEDGDLHREMSSIVYNACLTVMAQLRDTRQIGSGYLEPSSPSIAWIGDNQHKGVSRIPAVTIHSTPRFAATHLESDTNEWLPLLVAETEERLQTHVTSASGHRWRYADPQTTLGTSFALVAGSAPIVLAGEAFVSPRVEGAYLSGLAAARAVLEQLS